MHDSYAYTPYVCDIEYWFCHHQIRLYQRPGLMFFQCPEQQQHRNTLLPFSDMPSLIPKIAILSFHPALCPLGSTSLFFLTLTNTRYFTYLIACYCLFSFESKPKIQDFGLFIVFSPVPRYLTHYRHSINSVLISKFIQQIFINSSLCTIKYSKSEESSSWKKQNPWSHGTQYSPEGSNKKENKDLI